MSKVVQVVVPQGEADFYKVGDDQELSFDVMPDGCLEVRIEDTPHGLDTHDYYQIHALYHKEGWHHAVALDKLPGKEESKEPQLKDLKLDD